MNTVIKYTKYAFCAAVLLLASCVKDGLDSCLPESEYYSYIRFVYDYNMAYEDIFHNQVSNVDVFLFDENGVYIQSLSDEAPAGSKYFKKGYIMGLPETYKDAVQFVAFPGLKQERLEATKMIPGVSTIDELRVNLNSIPARSNGVETRMIDCTLEPFWHGGVTQTPTRVEKNDTTVIHLNKNFNKLRIVFQSLDDSKFDVNEFSVRLTCANKGYNAYNQLIDKNDCTYYPWYMKNDTEQDVAVVELNTLRMMADRENRFIIRHETSDNTILDVNLNKYLNALKLQAYTDMPLQEYMDREDSFQMIIFLKKEGNYWVAAQVSINEWEIRDQEGGI